MRSTTPGQVLVAFGLLAAACAGGSQGAPEPAEPETVQRHLDSIKSVGEDDELLHEARGRLVQACMQDAGFERYPEPYAGQAPLAPVRMTPDRGLYLLEEDAASDGFYLPTPGPEREDEQPTGPRSPDNQEYMASLSAEEREDYTAAYYGPDDEMLWVDIPGQEAPVGVPNSGCLAQALSELFGSVDDFVRSSYLAVNIEHEAWQRTLADEGVASSLDDWSSCMSRSGYEVSDPEELVARFLHSEGEATAAQTHADCLSVAGVREAVEESFEHYEAVVVAEREGEIVAFIELASDAAERAREVLS